MNKCLKCGKKLEGKQVLYCSERCCKLFLKSKYRKRKRAKVNEYNRKYRKKKKDTGYYIETAGCYFCESVDNLHNHHISYNPELKIRLCHTCHSKLHKIIKLMKTING